MTPQKTAKKKSEPLYEFTQPALAVSIAEAAHMVGISRSSFYNFFIRTKRLKPIALGPQCRVISVADLRATIEEMSDEEVSGDEGEDQSEES